MTTKKSARCLGIQWQSTSQQKILFPQILYTKARRAFFGLGSTKAFHGDLNPLSSSNIFETCVLPVLHGYETWLLYSSCIQALEKFQCEIGRRILKLSKYHANDVIWIGLHWPAVATRILLRKLTFSSKLLSNYKDTMSSRIFISLAIEDIYNISVVQQCEMLEATLATNIMDQCLSNPNNATEVVQINKKLLLKRDYEQSLSSAMSQPSVYPAAQIAQTVSWRRVWDNALYYGVKGTKCVQYVLRELCRLTFGENLCCLCKNKISCFSTHLFDCHPSLVCNKSLTEAITLISSLDMQFIISFGSKLGCSST